MTGASTLVEDRQGETLAEARVTALGARSPAVARIMMNPAPNDSRAVEGILARCLRPLGSPGHAASSWLVEGASPRTPVLTLEVTSKFARAALIAEVQGRQRVMVATESRVELARGQGAVSQAVRETIERLEVLGGVRLLEQEGLCANVRVAVAGGVPRLTVLLVASDIALAAALKRRLGSLTLVEVNDAVILSSGGPGDDGVLLQRAQSRIELMPPDLVAVGARSERDARVTAALLKSAAWAADESRTRAVLYAGPDHIAETLSNNLSDRFELHQVSSADWSSPSCDPTRASWDIEEVYLARNRARLHDLLGHLQTSTVALDDVENALSRVVRLLTESQNAGTGLLHITGQRSCFSFGVPGARRGEEVELLRMDTSLAIGEGTREVVDQMSIDRVVGWLPFDVDRDVLLNHIANRRIGRQPVPQDLRELLIELAVMRECALETAGRQTIPRIEILVASGELARVPRLGQAVLVLLDIVQPVAPCRLLIDSGDFLARLGCLGQVDPLAALSILQSDALVNVGPCLSLTGNRGFGEAVAEIELDRGLPGVEAETYQISYGSLAVIPLRSSERVTLHVSTEKGCSLGLESGTTAWASPNTDIDFHSSDAQVYGGMLGLIIDARGRPLETMADPLARQAQLMEWMQAVDALNADAFSRLDKAS